MEPLELQSGSFQLATFEIASVLMHAAPEHGNSYWSVVAFNIGSQSTSECLKQAFIGFKNLHKR